VWLESCVLLGEGKMEETRFDKFLKGIRGDLVQRERIRTQLLNANPIIGVDTLRNVIRGKSNPEATSLFERILQLDAFDASALAGLLVASQGQNI
jgi:hypothetical protein